MKFSLVNVIREYDGLVDGVWLQDHIGTIGTAADAARGTEQANNHKITVAVVEDLGCAEPNYSVRTALKRLDLAPAHVNLSKEYLDLREMVADEVAYKKLDQSVVDDAVRYIRDSSRLMQMLDLVVEEAISRCTSTLSEVQHIEEAEV